MNNNIKNLPDRQTINRIILELKTAELEKVSYEKVIYKILNELKLIPYASAKLKAGSHIERARINEPNQIFYSEKDISYRTDFNNIQKYGRANVPGQSLFYGSIKSDHIEIPRIINLFETSELFRSDEKEVNNEFVMTVGKWRIKQDFEVAEIVFNKLNVANIPQIRKSFEYHINKLKTETPDIADDIEFLLQFFSDEFAKKTIKSDSDYKVSAAYTELAIMLKNLAGVVYPSVRTDYQGFNVALSIPSVENFLELEIVAMFKVCKNGKEIFIDNLAYATDLGAMNSNFNWIDLKGTNEKKLNEILFKESK